MNEEIYRRAMERIECDSRFKPIGCCCGRRTTGIGPTGPTGPTGPQGLVGPTGATPRFIYSSKKTCL